MVTCGFDALGNYRVVISDLCKEMLTESTLSTWCAVARKVGWDKTCSDIRRERIEFTFGYVPDGEAFKITGTLSGKFGSGIYRPRGDTGWKDMTPDFGSWEKIFADKFLNILAERLRR